MKMRPKRRRSKDNPYILQYDECTNIYTVSFKNSNNIIVTTDVDKSIYEAFDKFELEDLSQMNKYDNHIEHFEVYEENLYKRSVFKPMSIESIVEKKIMLEKVKKHMNELPQIQKRRLKKYYFENKTFEIIAKEEKCTKRAIKFSVDIAITKIYQKMK